MGNVVSTMNAHDLRNAKLKAVRAVPDWEADDILTRARRVADVAARYADAVDREARFPSEAMAAARAEGLLGVMSPVQFGGEGATTGTVVEVCYLLGQACAS
ncbi:MAG TPA: acyl-CoA dehydrogenase family protein, partial [Caulobacteraceae bacterium]|nr:acyl-CoA dehydrogenase family protein [Caulobacteraceae bacterium]